MDNNIEERKKNATETHVFGLGELFPDIVPKLIQKAKEQGKDLYEKWKGYTLYSFYTVGQFASELDMDAEELRARWNKEFLGVRDYAKEIGIEQSAIDKGVVSKMIKRAEETGQIYALQFNGRTAYSFEDEKSINNVLFGDNTVDKYGFFGDMEQYFSEPEIDEIKGIFKYEKPKRIEKVAEVLLAVKQGDIQKAYGLYNDYREKTNDTMLKTSLFQVLWRSVYMPVFYLEMEKDIKNYMPEDKEWTAQKVLKAKAQAALQARKKPVSVLKQMSEAERAAYDEQILTMGAQRN